MRHSIFILMSFCSFFFIPQPTLRFLPHGWWWRQNNPVCVYVCVQVCLCAYEDIFREKNVYEKITRLNECQKEELPISHISFFLSPPPRYSKKPHVYHIQRITRRKYGTTRKVVLHVSLREVCLAISFSA